MRFNVTVQACFEFLRYVTVRYVTVHTVEKLHGTAQETREFLLYNSMVRYKRLKKSYGKDLKRTVPFIRAM